MVNCNKCKNIVVMNGDKMNLTACPFLYMWGECVKHIPDMGKLVDCGAFEEKQKDS